ncbi:coiled-coil domain-containing protein [Leucobacter sp. NPDC058333]|uniref:coiled-coil domain-containing protein n=1 Tax=Leucobacter sp. NPDC058333 TaxID=3346450 RepID=UPI0036519CFA
MRRQRLTRSTAVAALAASLVLAGTLPAIAFDGATSDDPSSYPTWEEVQAAKGSESAKKAEYTRLQGALKQTQSDASAASSAAADAHGAAREAATALADATARQDALQERAKQAEQQFDTNDEAVGRMVSWMYTNGSGLASAGALATSDNPEEFMSKFSMSSQVSGTWNGIAEHAQAEVNSAATLREQAEAAEAERKRLSDEADAAAAAADQAQQNADAAVALAGDRSDTVYKQLASLRGTSAETERQYQIGVQVAAQAAEQERQREEAARQEQERQLEQNAGSDGSGGGGGGGNDGSGGGSGGTGGTGGVSVDPAGAQAHARAVLGAYGWGDDQFSCLVSLWTGESDWRADALNPYSGAYGIPQALPAEKMATAGPDWLTNGNTQVDWGLAYIQSVYGSPCNAWGTWQSRNPHWY